MVFRKNVLKTLSNIYDKGFFEKKYSRHSQTSTIEGFSKIVNDLKPLINLVKSYIRGVSQSSEYDSARPLKSSFKNVLFKSLIVQPDSLYFSVLTL